MQEQARVNDADVLAHKSSGAPMCRQLVRVLARRQLNESVALDAAHGSAHPSDGVQRSARRAAPAVLLTGPRGCGKGTLCAALAAAAFPHPSSVLHLNMAHFAGPDGAARLLGPPPGMVGHREGGVLTQQLRKRRRFLLVAEELSRAHASVVEVLMNVIRDSAIEAGPASLDCRHVTVLATCHSGAAVGLNSSQLQARGGSSNSAMSVLTPFWDAEIALDALSISSAARIARQQLAGFMERLHRWRGCEIDVSDEVLTSVLRRSAAASSAAQPGSQQADPAPRSAADQTAEGRSSVEHTTGLHAEQATGDDSQRYDGDAIAKAVTEVEERTLDVAIECDSGTTIHVGIEGGELRAWDPMRSQQHQEV